jgi:hypothetical protein
MHELLLAGRILSLDQEPLREELLTNDLSNLMWLVAKRAVQGVPHHFATGTLSLQAMGRALSQRPGMLLNTALCTVPTQTAIRLNASTPRSRNPNLV